MKDFFEQIAPRVGVTAEQFAKLSGPEALQLYVSSLEKAGASQQEMTFYLEAMASDATNLLPLLRNGGAEMTRLGDRAADLGAVLDQRALSALNRANVALIGVGQAFAGIRNRIATAMAPMVAAVADGFVAMAASGGLIDRALDGVLANLGRLAAYAGSFAAVMAVRWVVGLAVAALVFLRGALIRTGIGALIVGVGELIYQFGQFATKVGGVGAAFRLLSDVAKEVWSRIGLSLDAAFTRMAAGWEGLKADSYAALEATIAGVVSFGDRTAAIFQGAYDAAVAIWGKLPGAIGDFAFQAANGLISGVEAMLNGVVTRINRFIEGLNAALALLPDWAVGEGGLRIGTLEPVDLGRIGNPFAGAASEAGSAAADAFSAALGRSYLEPPDLGLGARTDDARARSAAYSEAAGMLSDAAGRPLASWQALQDAVAAAGTEGEDALTGAAASADALNAALDGAAGAAKDAGGAAGGAGKAAKEAAEEAKAGWQAVTQALSDYVTTASNWGKGLGETLSSAFSSAEGAFREFVKTGKGDFKGLVQSLLADLATLALRTAVLGPLAQALGGAFGGGLGSTAVATTAAAVLHTGGHVGQAGTSRSVPLATFANAPRLHRGGWAGVRPDEVPAILQRGERVLSRGQAAQAADQGKDRVEVVVTLDESTGRLGAFVRREAGGVAQAVVGAYDTHMLPQRVQQIGADTRVRGR